MSHAPIDEVLWGKAEQAFRPGLVRHYKGGLYTAMALVAHHEKRYPMVLYVSHTYGGFNVRPAFGVDGDPDGFFDMISDDKGRVCRFRWLGGVPSDTPIKERL